MNLWELTAPCHFGTEAVLKREILDLGYEVTRVEDGRVTFEADAQGVADANLFLRTTERVLLKVGEVKAETFDELFEKTKALPWENYIPKNGKFWVAKANSIKSKLFSPSDIQSIMKKAIVASQRHLRDFLVSGRRSGISYPCGLYERRSSDRNRHFRSIPS